MRKLVIPRGLWIRGESSPLGPSLLLAPGSSGGRCCVGHYLSACGVPDLVLEGRGAADDLHGHDLPEEVGWLLGPGFGRSCLDATDELPARSEDAQLLYWINDACHGSCDSKWAVESEASRERRIAEVFARHGVEVEFTGEGGLRDG